MNEITLRSESRCQLIDVTGHINGLIRQAELDDGVCLIFVPHTTAGLTVNENADPSVAADLQDILARLAPAGADYRHLEGNSDAHAKASLMGSSLSLIVGGGSLRLGTWQGVYFCEFDGPRRRKVWVKLLRA